MSSDTKTTVDPHQKVQIYSPSNGEISAFWRDKYEKEAKKYWDIFYKRHQDKFFKDRHYLDKEWGHYFSGEERKVILEVGCGVGNTIFPLLSTYPNLFINACDFSSRAVNLVKMHKEFTEAKVNAFVCDLTLDDLTQHISPSSLDIVTMIFVLSAVSPEKMPQVLQNIKKVLKPNGYVLFRDYATGDLAQERLISKEQKISENFYVRGDGTRAFYFSEEFLTNLFKENGFNIVEHVLCCKKVENRSREIVMNRRWVQSVFSIRNDANTLDEGVSKLRIKDITGNNASHEPEIDMSDGIFADMFGLSSFNEQTMEVSLKDYYNFKINVLSKENQHTCKSTGLSSRLMASILAKNQKIVSEKRVLELGCGCAGICSMIATKTAKLVVATDGDIKSIDLLKQNVGLNLEPSLLSKIIIKKLEWGDKDDIEEIKKVCDGGFDVIIGTDVTYVAEAILPLFKTAKELIIKEGCLILCHVVRRVDEGSILFAANECGFKLVCKWPEEEDGLVKGLLGDINENNVPTTALNIMYFQRVE